MNLNDIKEQYLDILTYVDVSDGMKRIGNNKKLYKMLLGTFLGDQNYTKMCDLMSSGDFAPAASCAHAIKGVAANLSFKNLYEISTNVEKLLKEGSDASSEFAQMKDSMAKTIDYVNVLIANAEDL